MTNPFNNKLYNQYYPLKTEDDKKKFFDSHCTEIHRAAENLYNCAETEIFEREHRYIHRMKPDMSRWGTPKWRNIAHNKAVAMEWDGDMNIRIAKEKIPELASLANKVHFHEYDSITIEELNRILRFVNTETHKTWGRNLLLLALIIIVVCKFLF